MEEKINNYLEKLVVQCFEIPAFKNLYGDQRNQVADNLRNHFYNLIIDVTIDNMNEEQFMKVKDLDFNSPEAEDKLIEVSAEIPGLAEMLEERLNQELATIQQTQQIPQQTPQ